MIALDAIETQSTHGEAVKAACSRIPPLWPLQNFVAVNPFLGLSGVPFHEAADLMERASHNSILMEPAFYLDKIRSGEIADQDVDAALRMRGVAWSPRNPALWLEEQLLQQPERPQVLLTVADWLDRNSGSHWAEFITDEVSKWCSAYFDRGQSLWKMPWRDLDLYEAWKQAALYDANPEVMGLRSFRQFVEQLPASPADLISQAFAQLNVPDGLWIDLLHRELVSVYGWSAYAAYFDRQDKTNPMLPQLLAIRLAYDLALLTRAPGWQCMEGDAVESGISDARHVAQLALESRFRNQLIGRLQSGTRSKDGACKELQAVFCIDVRSEVLRRALESQSPAIETIGFAGFFGMPIEYGASARCPVLIDPKVRVHGEPRKQAPVRTLADGFLSSWQNLFKSAVACFASVEASGIFFGWNLLRSSAGIAKPPAIAPDLSWSIPLSDRIALAAGALKNMSLDPRRLAPVVLICGHGSQTENNPYASSLDCGACGGHKGDVNARFAAAILNDPEVREGLRRQDVCIPEDTHFVAGLHDTLTDSVTLYQVEQLPPKLRGDLERWLRNATREARNERNPSLANAHTPDRVDREVRRRSADWSEVRPEWGLAGNAAFVAGPRARTRGVNLGGRVFLHDYDWTVDSDNSALSLILTAPVVVASWINLQYYGSTVNNRLFGSGNKVLHNVVGGFGVWEGNAGDLRTGLPLQSLHDGDRWVHEPLRLQVFVEAPRHRIAQVLERHQAIRDLANNGWIHLIAVEGDDFSIWQETGEWKKITPSAAN